MKQIWVYGLVAELNNKGGFIMLPDAEADALIAAGKAHIACSPFTKPVAGVETAWHGWQAKVDPVRDPEFVVPPSITGATVVGSTLTCDPGEWIAYPAPTVSYQWESNGAPISLATNAIYVTQAGDVGFSITCSVTITNASGSDVATSSAIVPTAT